jgi:predicted chitinase
VNKEDFEKLTKRAKIRETAKKRGLRGKELDHFMAQVAVETGDFEKFSEDPRHSVATMRELFNKARTLKDGTILGKKHYIKNKNKYKSSDFKYSDDDLKKISPLYKKGGTADSFFDFAYSNRKDLKTGPGEGKDFYGIGAIQLTGKFNRKKYGIETAEDRRRMIEDMEFSANKSIDYFKDITKNIDLNKASPDKVTEKVNKGTTSYAKRRKAYEDERVSTEFEDRAPFSDPAQILEKIKERANKNKNNFELFMSGMNLDDNKN